MCDLISRQWLMECVNEGWIKFDTEKDENRFVHLVRDIAPSAQLAQDLPNGCTDSISRQAAIDALDKRFDGVPMELTTEILELRRDLRERIPSAQPAASCSEIPNGSDDTISRQAAIDALARMMPRSYTPDGSHPADEEIFRAQEVIADCIEALEILPSVQPATSCSEIPNGSDDTISRQAAIEAMGKAKWAKERLMELPSVQPDHVADVSKKVDRDFISRQAVVKFFNDWISCLDENCHHQSVADMTIIKNDFKNLPSAQPERKKGHWLRYGEDGYPNNEDTVFWQCDQCLEQYTGRTKKIPNFCPNCGADMREATHEQT